MVTRFSSLGLITQAQKPRHPGGRPKQAQTVWEDPYADLKAFRLSLGMTAVPVSGDRYPTREAAKRAQILSKKGWNRIRQMQDKGIEIRPEWRLQRVLRIWVDPMEEYLQFRRSLGMPVEVKTSARYPSREHAREATRLRLKCRKRLQAQKDRRPEWLPSPEELA